MNEVIPDDAEFSSSIALMEWLTAAHRSAAEVMAAMREGGGTMARADDRAARLKGGRIGEFAVPGLLQNDALSGPRQPMRQGIASGFRHVAPALLLC